MLVEYSRSFFPIILVVLLIRSFLFEPFRIPSDSMMPTLLDGAFIFVNKFTYGLKIPFTHKVVLPLSDPEFQDIVVFEFPEDTSKDFIKRIIGLPGDTIQIRDKKLIRNGVEVEESYVQHTDGSIVPRRDNFGPITVPEGKYFVMGDNRDESYDSRFWGFVERNKIEGRAWILYWSWQGFQNIRWNRIGQTVE